MKNRKNLFGIALCRTQYLIPFRNGQGHAAFRCLLLLLLIGVSGRAAGLDSDPRPEPDVDLAVVLTINEETVDTDLFVSLLRAHLEITEKFGAASQSVVNNVKSSLIQRFAILRLLEARLPIRQNHSSPPGDVISRLIELEVENPPLRAELIQAHVDQEIWKAARLLPDSEAPPSNSDRLGLFGRGANGSCLAFRAFSIPVSASETTVRFVRDEIGKTQSVYHYFALAFSALSETHFIVHEENLPEYPPQNVVQAARRAQDGTAREIVDDGLVWFVRAEGRADVNASDCSQLALSLDDAINERSMLLSDQVRKLVAKSRLLLNGLPLHITSHPCRVVDRRPRSSGRSDRVSIGISACLNQYFIQE